MRAFHSTWTSPFVKTRGMGFYIEDFELLTMMLSALKWQEFNGDIKMITDDIGAAYYRQLGLEHLWNLGIEECLTPVGEDLNPSVFWAAGKLYALEGEVAPCVMLDTDFIVWQKIERQLQQGEVAVIHKEELNPHVYPDKAYFQMSPEYKFLDGLNWEVKPCNTALMYIGDEGLKQFYIDESKRFMRAAQGEDPITYMVFAEQRLLAMCADMNNKEIIALADVDQLFSTEQKTFTHLWGYKRYLRSHPKEREDFCRRCMKRIKKDYPEFYKVVLDIEVLTQYAEK